MFSTPTSPFVRRTTRIIWPHPRSNRISAISVFALSALLSAMLPADALGDPGPGDVWREYPVALGADGMFRIGGRFGGSSNLDVNYPLAPFRLSQDEAQPPAYEIDLEGAVRAEVTVGYNQSHNRAPFLYLSINNHEYRLLEYPASVPNRGYFFHIFPTIEIPLGELLPKDNQFKFTNRKWLDNPSGYEAGYDQSLVYELILRVYYEPGIKDHPTGRITSPVSGAALDASEGARTRITAAATDAVEGGDVQVDFIGDYYDYDRSGDTQWRRWHYRWKHFGREDHLTLVDHIGTSTAAPHEVEWDMEWIPDQAQPFRVSAILTGSNGVKTFLEPVGGLYLVRPDRSVELALPTLTPANFKSSASRVESRTAEFLVEGDPRLATDARLCFQFWFGAGNDDMGLQINGTHHPTFYPDEAIPPELLIHGTNRIVIDKGGHHGMEVLWPGVGVYLVYDIRTEPGFLAEPEDTVIQPGDDCGFRARVSGIPEPSYQWQVLAPGGEWTDIPGEQGPELALRGVAAALDRHSFRLVARNASGTSYSDPAILRVSPDLPAFLEEGGVLVVEAERFDAQDLNGEDYGWMGMARIKNYAGSGYIWTYHENSTRSTWGTGATVRYRIHLGTSGEYTTWLRVRNRQVNKNHSVILGFDGVEAQPLYPDKGEGDWQWIRSQPMALGTGIHTLELMRRSDGLFVDRICLTSDPGFDPASVNDGLGPEESVRGIGGLAFSRD